MDLFFNCDEFEKYRVDLPYPEVTITKQNRRYATILSDAFAGKGSEMTAITQYATHRFLVQEYPEVANAYKYIASVEIIHWTFLGNLIRELGLIPQVLSYETNQPWNGCFPVYRTTFEEIINSDYEGEKASIAHYKRMINCIDNSEMQALFQRIILDEENHIRILTDLYKRHK